MRRLISTLVLLGVLGGLVAYIYFIDANRDPGAVDARPRAFEVTADSIEALEIRNADGETVRLQKVNDAWQLTEPVAADGDGGVVGTVTSGLAGLEVQRVVDENPADLAQYGLDPARIDVGFRLQGQPDFQHLLVGEKTPTGGDLYAKRPDEDRVFLISSYLDSIFNRTPFDLRDKAILKFERDSADAIEITGGPSPLRLTRQGTEWRLAEPIAARADYAAAEGILTRLSSTHMDRVVEPEAGDLAQYGLSQPVLTASVLSGSSKATLLLGRSDEMEVFAKDSNRTAVFTVEPAVLADLQKDPSELRRKDLFDARSFTANRLELRRGDETVALDKSGTGEEETWRNAAGQEIELARAEDLMTKLANMRAQSFESGMHPSLNTPVLVVTIRFDESRTETVTFGRSNDEAFASRGDEPGTARIDASQLEEAIVALDGLQ
jgi:hypothetical protein